MAEKYTARGDLLQSFNLPTAEEAGKVSPSHPSHPPQKYQSSIYRPRPQTSPFKPNSPTSRFRQLTGDAEHEYIKIENRSSRDDILRCSQSRGLSIEDTLNREGEFLPSQSTASRMLAGRMLRQVASLRQIHDHLRGEMDQQQRSFAELHRTLDLQCAAKFQMYELKMREKEEARLELMKSSMVSVEVDLQHKTHQNEQLIKELYDLREKSPGKEHRERSPRHEQRSRGSSFSCPNCKLLEIKTGSIREEAVQSGKQLAILESENEKLQEQLFDLQQQVIGIELQVEKRVKTAVLNIPEMGYNNRPSSQMVEGLMKNLDKAETRCKHYESLCRSEQELTQREQELNQIIHQYELKNQSLFEAISRHEETNSRNYEKEHQLLLAEEQLFTKEEELRTKEVELSEWEVSLTSKQHELNRPSGQLQLGWPERNQASQHVDQISMTNIGGERPAASEAQQEYYSDYRVILPTREQNNDRGREVVPRLSLNGQEYGKGQGQGQAYMQEQHESRQTFARNPPQISHYNSRYSVAEHDHRQPKNEGQHFGRRHERGNDSRYSKRMSPSGSKQALMGKTMGVRMHDANSRHKYEVGRSNYEGESRHSAAHGQRSSSPPRSFKSSHISHNLSRSHANPGYGNSYVSAEGKLQKLREELKRELESIK